MNRIICLGIAFCLLAAITGCGGESSNTPTTQIKKPEGKAEKGKQSKGRGPETPPPPPINP